MDVSKRIICSKRQEAINILKKEPQQRNVQEQDNLTEYLKNNFQLFDLFINNGEKQDIIKKCTKVFQYKYVPKGNFLLHEGDVPDNFYILFEGQGDVYIKKDLETIEKKVKEDKAIHKKLIEIQQDISDLNSINQNDRNPKQEVQLLQLKLELQRVQTKSKEIIDERERSKHLMAQSNKIKKYFTGNVCCYQKVSQMCGGVHFGEIGIFTKGLRNASIFAAKDLHMAYLPGEIFVEIFGEMFLQMNYALNIFKNILTQTSWKKIIKLSYEFKPKIYNPREVIYSEGDEPLMIYLVKSGNIEISKLLENGDEQNFFYKRLQNQSTKLQQMSPRKRKIKCQICELSEGVFFGHEDIIQNQQRQFTATTLSKVEVLVLHKDIFLSLNSEEIKEILNNYAGLQDKFRAEQIQKSTKSKEIIRQELDQQIKQKNIVEPRVQMKDKMFNIISNFNQNDKNTKDIFIKLEPKKTENKNQEKQNQDIYQKIINSQKQRYMSFESAMNKKGQTKIHDCNNIQRQIENKQKIAEKTELWTNKFHQPLQISIHENTDNPQNDLMQDIPFMSQDMTSFEELRKRIIIQKSGNSLKSEYDGHQVQKEMKVAGVKQKKQSFKKHQSSINLRDQSPKYVPIIVQSQRNLLDISRNSKDLSTQQITISEGTNSQQSQNPKKQKQGLKLPQLQNLRYFSEESNLDQNFIDKAILNSYYLQEESKVKSPRLMKQRYSNKRENSENSCEDLYLSSTPLKLGQKKSKSHKVLLNLQEIIKSNNVDSPNKSSELKKNSVSFLLRKEVDSDRKSYFVNTKKRQSEAFNNNSIGAHSEEMKELLKIQRVNRKFLNKTEIISDDSDLNLHGLDKLESIKYQRQNDGDGDDDNYRVSILNEAVSNEYYLTSSKAEIALPDINCDTTLDISLAFMPFERNESQSNSVDKLKLKNIAKKNNLKISSSVKPGYQAQQFQINQSLPQIIKRQKSPENLVI